MGRIGSPRKENQGGFLLIHARQIKQIRILFEAHAAIGIAGHDVVGDQNGHAAIRQGSG